ncbi:threonine synthase [hydrocarbon metagenome]|uniref:Threonine synthase n=1 Tax=hydrocarbon metagenome TaxID=938273 RepID=A0A0W8FX25_9ZZZZ
MKNYYYKCTACNKNYTSAEIESNKIYLCPNCGSCEKNQPLKGVLSIEYDYEHLKNIYTKDKFLSFTAGQIWSYPQLWPIDFNKDDRNDLEKLSLPSNQILRYKIDGRNLLFQDETRNPTYSYKDRASILVALKAKELGINEIAAASTGNAGSSLAGICARLGITSHVFVPKNIPEAKRIQIQSYGANIYLVDGDYDQAFDLCLEISTKNNWYNRNTAYNPLTIEGKKSSAFDIYINLKGRVPRVIFVPVGDGVILSGLHKGFVELKRLELIDYLPKLIAVQAEGSGAVVDFITSEVFEYKPANTIADSISAGAPRNLYLAAKSVKESNGYGIKVSDDEILSAQKELAYKTGLLVEPSCASTFAAYQKVKSNFEKDEKIMLLMTGSGLKDFEALKTWNEKPAVKNSEEWKSLLID